MEPVGGMGLPERKDRFLYVAGQWYPLTEPRYKATPWVHRKRAGKKPWAPKPLEPGIPIGCGQCDACFERVQDQCEERKYV